MDDEAQASPLLRSGYKCGEANLRDVLGLSLPAAQVLNLTFKSNDEQINFSSGDAQRWKMPQ